MTKALAAVLEERVRNAMGTALGAVAEDVDPLLRRSDHADFQANGVLPLAKVLKANPRDLALRVAAALAGDDAIVGCEVAGPGFLNLTVADQVVWGSAAARLGDPRLGVPTGGSGAVTVVDYSQPNIAKEMHVGHLRSTVIGDALVRTLEFGGTKAVRQNHLGDWGTQFGMLIEYLFEHDELRERRPDESGSEAISRLGALYRDARARFVADPEFVERARRRVVALQSGDAETLAGWREIVAESKVYFEDVYRRLGVLLVDEDAVGESFYNPFLTEITDDLEQRGIAVRSNGALCVFFDDVLGPDGEPAPLIVRKSDGGFGYAATDLAAIRHRVRDLGADRILYVVDARQALHFRTVFETARRAGYLPDGVQAVHVAFGSVLGPDGKPFKTRAGDTVRLISLLDDAIEHARRTVAEKNPDLDPALLAQRAVEVGIGAVKYADLSTSRTRDYVFDLDRMVSLTGNTSVYLQYAHARCRSILGKLPSDASRTTIHPVLESAPAERRLVLLLDELSATLQSVADTFEPHKLCSQLYAIAQAFSEFFEHCPVLKAPSAEVRDNRAALCLLTADTLKLGLGLLGIAAPDQL